MSERIKTIRDQLAIGFSTFSRANMEYVLARVEELEKQLKALRVPDEDLKP